MREGGNAACRMQNAECGNAACRMQECGNVKCRMQNAETRCRPRRPAPPRRCVYKIQNKNRLPIFQQSHTHAKYFQIVCKNFNKQKNKKTTHGQKMNITAKKVLNDLAFATERTPATPKDRGPAHSSKGNSLSHLCGLSDTCHNQIAIRACPHLE